MSVNKVNKDRITREWRAANKEHVSIYNKAYKIANNDKSKSASRLYARSPQGRYKRAKITAQETGRDFTMTFAQYSIFFLENPCAYCAGPLNPTGSALDRKDNNKGYTVENVVSCCHRCNSAKGAWFTHEEFKVMIQAVIKFRKQKDV